MEKWVTKKNIIFVTLLVLALSVITDFFNIIKYTIVEPITGFFLFILISVLIISPFKNIIFSSWIRLLVFVLPLSMGFIWINRDGGMLSPGAEGASIISGMFIFLMSLSLILIKSWELKALDHSAPVNPWLKWLLFVLAFVASIALSIFLYGFIQ